MKKFTNLLNRFFISIVLFLFYFLIIGISSIIHRIMNLLGKQDKDTYWSEDFKKIYSKEYFSSPY